MGISQRVFESPYYVFGNLSGLSIYSEVLGLGAGFDSMYFRLKNCNIIPEGVNYFEVDYPESVKRKDARIFKSSYLRSFFHKRNVIKNDIFVYNDGRFTLVGCDMIQVNELLSKFQLSGFDPNAETLILTECSTTYIHADQCENLLNMLTSYLKKFAYISYEQIRKEVLIFLKISN